MGIQPEIGWSEIVSLRSRPPSGRPEPRSPSHPLDSRQEPPSRDIQICQPAADLQPVGVLCQPAVSDFGPSEDPLDHQERMFNLGTDLRLHAIPNPLFLTQWPMAMRFRLDETLGLGRVLPDHLALSTVGGITPDARLLAMQQLGQHLTVMHIGGCPCH